MRYCPLGSSGLVVSVVGLGCNNFGRRLDLERSRTVIEAALDSGITFFDTADTYGDTASETFLGEVLKTHRDQVVLATKFGSPMHGRNGPDWVARGSRAYIRRAVEASLARLKTDHIDLYQYHLPDRITPIEETLSALSELIEEGKVGYVGSSNLSGWEVADAAWTARARRLAPFVSAQNNYSLIDRRAEAELVPACRRFGVGVIPYFPLANGLLTGKYRRGEPPPGGTRLSDRQGALDDSAFDRLDRVQAFASSVGRSVLEVAIGGLAAQQTVASVIAGATSPDQVKANAEAGEWVPDADELAELNRAVPSRHPF